MSDLEDIYRAVDRLSAEEVRALYHYLTEHRLRFVEPDEALKQTETEKVPRKLGLHAHLGPARLSDDFFDELPDSFWLGEE